MIKFQFKIIFLKQFWRNRQLYAFFLTENGLILFRKNHQIIANAWNLTFPLQAQIIPSKYFNQWEIIPQTLVQLPVQQWQIFQLMNDIIIQTFQQHQLPISLFQFYLTFWNGYAVTFWPKLMRLLNQICQINGLNLLTLLIWNNRYHRLLRLILTNTNDYLQTTISQQTYYWLFGFGIYQLANQAGLIIQRSLWNWLQAIID